MKRPLELLLLVLVLPPSLERCARTCDSPLFVDDANCGGCGNVCSS